MFTDAVLILSAVSEQVTKIRITVTTVKLTPNHQLKSKFLTSAYNLQVAQVRK